MDHAMNRHAVCILCHHKPEQVNAIVDLFPPAYFDFYIHVDRKSDMQGAIRRASNVFFVADDRRVDVGWGRYSQVEVYLALLDRMDPAAYSCIHFISGEDFPIKPPMRIYEICEREKREYIVRHALPEETSWGWGGLDRVLVRYPDWMIRRHSHRVVRALRVAWRECVMRTGLLKRRDAPVDKFYGGHSWFSLTGECVQWMKVYLRAHPEYCRFFRTGFCVDEIFFQTLCAHSPFADRIANDARRYMRWKGSKTGGPHALTEADIPAMRDHNGFFARKVESIGLCRAMRRQLIDGQ